MRQGRDPKRLDGRDFDSAALMRDHPPRFANENKRRVFAAAMRPGEIPSGTITFSRWSEAVLPARWIRRALRPTERGGFFVYGEPATPGTVQWHLNFAMSDCFGAYAGPLLAQDELQVLEHPALASLREAASAEGFSVLCVEGGRPTPVLVRGVERRVHFDTTGAERGLYGNEFARADRAAITRATKRIEPPTRTNVLAIEAPAYGSGAYERDEVETILLTAVSGFRAAVLETREAAQGSPAARTVVHTGWWGCGAYGGNSELMALLQLVAAEIAGVDELVFYSVDEQGSATLASAQRQLDALAAECEVPALIDTIVAKRYVWGMPNGT